MKTLKKTLAVLLAALMAFACCVVAFAADEFPVFIDVEGISKNLYEGSVTVPAGSTVLDVLKATGLNVVTREETDGVYVVSIAGDTEKTFGGKDGWYYDIGFDAYSVPMNKQEVKHNDSIHIYYADPAVGFQKPIMETCFDEGYIRFYSEGSDPATGDRTEVPVVGATMVIDGAYTYVTDENGKVYLPENLCENVHSFTLERYTEQGLPTILRAFGNYGFDPTLGPNLPVSSFLSRVFDWFMNIIHKIGEFFRGLIK